MKEILKQPKTNKRTIGFLSLIIGFAIAYLPSYIHKILNLIGIDIGPDGPSSTLIWNWLAVALLVAFILFIEKRRLSSILLIKPKQKDIEWALWFWGIGMSASWLLQRLFPPSESYGQGLESVVGLPILVVIGLIFTTAVTEEILFKGYPIERLREFSGKMWIGVLVSMIIFVLPHLQFFGPHWLLYQGIGVLLSYILFVWRRNLYACILLHLLGNAPLFIFSLLS